MRGAFGRALAAFLSEPSLEARIAGVPAAQLGPECVEILRLARQEREDLPDEELVAAAVRACLTAMQRDGDRVLRNLAKHCSALAGTKGELAHAS
jgi:hypothetical protein